MLGLRTAGLAIPCAVALVIGTGLGPIATPAQAQTVARTGELTTELVPPSGASARQIKKATVRQDLVKQRISAVVALRATPTASTNAVVDVEFGHLDGGVCRGEFNVSTETFEPGAGAARNGAKLNLNKSSADAGYEDWDCAFAVAHPVGDPDAPYHAVGTSNLRDIVGKPSTKITKVKLLGQVVKKRLKAVPGAWTPLDITIRSNGTADAAKIVVSGKGPRLKVKKGKVGWTVAPGSTGSTTVRVKLLKAKKSTLTLTSKAKNGAGWKRQITVVPAKPPTKPKAGKYRGDSGRVNFRIDGKGRIVGFGVRSFTTCGGYPDLPTYTWTYYDFPAVTVGRNGIVYATRKGENYSVHLELQAIGKTVKHGRFNYSGPNRCQATSTFKAKRR